MNFLTNILNTIFPINCISCGKNQEYLCSSCLDACPSASRESAKWIFPIYDYRHPTVKSAIWFLKYKGKKKIADIFAETLYSRLLEELSDLSQLENFNKPILIPIPLSAKRLRERGFNQAELICKKLIKLDLEQNFKLNSDILIKSKNTEHQANILNRSERLKNIKGSFTLKNINDVVKRNIILIDDVVTTGATLSEAKKVLKEAGAKKIIAFTIAH